MNEFINKKNSLRNLNDNEFLDILPILSKELFDNGFIYPEYSIEEIKKDWNNLLKKKINKNLSTNISATNTLGLKIIKHFMKNFYHVKNFKNKSIHDLWTIDNIKKALIFNKKYHSTPYISEIIRSISFTNGLGCITIYRPLLAKNIIHYFNINSVIDISIGWGGRMIGCKAANENLKYIGFEPNTETFNNLNKIIQILDLKNVLIYNEPAEKMLLTINETFDMALTSPPYYNLEIYSQELTQSHHYGSYENWKNKFLEPIIINLLTKVKYSAWSVKNFKTDKQYNLFDDIVEIHNKLNWKLLPIIFTMNNSKRPGNHKNNLKSQENTYIFIKN
jgi:hypothetical protein